MQNGNTCGGCGSGSGAGKSSSLSPDQRELIRQRLSELKGNGDSIGQSVSRAASGGSDAIFLGDARLRLPNGTSIKAL